MVRLWSQVGLQPLWSLGALAWRYVGHFLSSFNQAPSFLTSSYKMGLAEGCLEMPAPCLVAVTKLIAWLPDKRVTSSFSLKLVGKRNIPVLASEHRAAVPSSRTHGQPSSATSLCLSSLALSVFVPLWARVCCWWQFCPGENVNGRPSLRLTLGSWGTGRQDSKDLLWRLW